MIMAEVSKVSFSNDPASAGGPTGLEYAIPLGLTSLCLTGSISHPSDARVEPNPHELGNAGNPSGNRFQSIILLTE